MEDARYQVLLAKIYSKMKMIDEAVVSLQQVKGRTKNSMKACHILTFIPGFTFIQDSYNNIFVNEENAYMVGIKHRWLVQNVKSVSGYKD